MVLTILVAVVALAGGVYLQSKFNVVSVVEAAYKTVVTTVTNVVTAIKNIFVKKS